MSNENLRRGKHKHLTTIPQLKSTTPQSQLKSTFPINVFKSNFEEMKATSQQ